MLMESDGVLSSWKGQCALLPGNHSSALGKLLRKYCSTISGVSCSSVNNSLFPVTGEIRNVRSLQSMSAVFAVHNSYRRDW
jgi:hypothetical protein